MVQVSCRLGTGVVQVRFRILVAGLVLLPAGAGGTIIGGLLVEKLKLSCRQIIHIQLWLSVFVTVTSALFLLTCDPIPFAGISAPYNTRWDVLPATGFLKRFKTLTSNNVF